jgi:signal transduction histidine kinase
MDTLLDTAPCGFLSVRDDSSIIIVNRTLQEWLSYSLDELQGQHIDTVLPAASRIFYQTHLFPLLRIHGHVEEVYFPLRRKDSGNIPMLVNAVRRDADVVYDFVFMPMNQRNQYENAILDSKAAAEEARRAKDEAYADLEAFAFSVSHDLRTPLANIRIFAEFVLKDYADKLDQEGKEYLEHIAESASEMAKMTQEILDYSRTSASVLQLEPVSLEKVLSRAEDQLRADFSRRNVQFDVVKPLPSVRGHPILLEQIVVNLLSNAIKFVSPNVGPEIKVWTERCLTPLPMVRLWIEDNGIGIAQSDQKRVFHLFERGQVSDQYAGTGVGLAIVQKGIERMGGRVGFESTLGVGSRFWLELPESERSNADMSQ